MPVQSGKAGVPGVWECGKPVSTIIKARTGAHTMGFFDGSREFGSKNRGRRPGKEDLPESCSPASRGAGRVFLRVSSLSNRILRSRIVTGTTVRLIWTGNRPSPGNGTETLAQIAEDGWTYEGHCWRGSCQSSQRAGADLHVESHPAEQKDHTVETSQCAQRTRRLLAGCPD